MNVLVMATCFFFATLETTSRTLYSCEEDARYAFFVFGSSIKIYASFICCLILSSLGAVYMCFDERDIRSRLQASKRQKRTQISGDLRFWTLFFVSVGPVNRSDDSGGVLSQQLTELSSHIFHVFVTCNIIMPLKMPVNMLSSWPKQHCAYSVNIKL